MDTSLRPCLLNDMVQTVSETECAVFRVPINHDTILTLTDV